MRAKSLYSGPTLRDPVDCSLPDSSVMGFSRQKYWSGRPFPPPRDLPDPRDQTRDVKASFLAALRRGGAQLFLRCGARASHSRGFSGPRAQAPGVQAPWPWCRRGVARPTYGMGNLPGPGWNPCPCIASSGKSIKFLL